MYTLTLFLSVALLNTVLTATTAQDTENTKPMQVHLSINEDFSEYVFTWSTWNYTDSAVEYGTDLVTLGTFAFGDAVQFIDGGDEQRQQWIHKVVVGGFEDDTQYFYQVGSNFGWSRTFYFKVPSRSDPQWKPTIAIYGDMGLRGAEALPLLSQEAQDGTIDITIQVGDYAYDLDEDNSRVGDEFMDSIEVLAGYVPFMTIPGNHDDAYNFSNYKYRFNMPGENEGMFYTYNVGPIRFITFTTEFYYRDYDYTTNILEDQYNFIVEELQRANEPANRAAQPWIIMYAHRPMFCSSINFNRDCIHEECRVRVGMPDTHEYALEILLMQYNVDMIFWGHTHNYERFLPFYDYDVYNGTESDPYMNPGAPVHIISGSGGNKELQEPFFPVEDPWLGFHSVAFGYTRITAHNGTHLEIHQVAVNQEEHDMDKFWLVSENHDFGFTP